MPSTVDKISSRELLGRLKIQDTSTPAPIDAEYRKWFAETDILFAELKRRFTGGEKTLQKALEYAEGKYPKWKEDFDEYHQQKPDYGWDTAIAALDDDSAMVVSPVASPTPSKPQPKGKGKVFVPPIVKIIGSSQDLSVANTDYEYDPDKFDKNNPRTWPDTANHKKDGRRGTFHSFDLIECENKCTKCQQLTEKAGGCMIDRRHRQRAPNGKLKCNRCFTQDQRCTMQTPTVAKKSTRAKSRRPVATAENTEADNLIAVLDDSNLTNNARAIRRAISVVDWRLEGNAEDIRLLTADRLALEDRKVDLQLLLDAADEDSEDDTHDYIRTGSPVPFEPRSRKRERSRSASMTSSKPSASLSGLIAPLLNSRQSSQQSSSHQEPVPSYDLRQLNTASLTMSTNSSREDGKSVAGPSSTKKAKKELSNN